MDVVKPERQDKPAFPPSSTSLQVPEGGIAESQWSCGFSHQQSRPLGPEHVTHNTQSCVFPSAAMTGPSSTFNGPQFPSGPMADRLVLSLFIPVSNKSPFIYDICQPYISTITQIANISRTVDAMDEYMKLYNGSPNFNKTLVRQNYTCGENLTIGK